VDADARQDRRVRFRAAPTVTCCSAARRPAEKGVWLPGPVVPNPLQLKDIPFQPWAKALFADRNTNELEPHTRCKPSGVARQFLTPYGVEMVELPELQRVFVFDIGGPHTFREVFMDGRSHPKNFTPTYYGPLDRLVGGRHDGDGHRRVQRRVLDGSRRLPHTSQMHTIEKFTRTDFNTIRYQLTVDDPGAYTKPIQRRDEPAMGGRHRALRVPVPADDYATELMVGSFEKVDRKTLIIP
jgi:hypothetical protein